MKISHVVIFIVITFALTGVVLTFFSRTVWFFSSAASNHLDIVEMIIDRGVWVGGVLFATCALHFFFHPIAFFKRLVTVRK